MLRKFYYLFSLLFVFILPAIVAGYFVIDTIHKGHLAAFVFLITIVGSIWDIWATKHGMGDPIWLWKFNYKETLGVRVFGLPIEEYLFYISSSLYIIFIWEAIKLANFSNVKILFIVVPALGLWTLLSILIPYKFGPKGDKLSE